MGHERPRYAIHTSRGVFTNNLPSGHFFLTELLVPALAAGAKTSPDGHARVVTTSSSGAYFASGLQWETFKEHPNRHKMGPKGLYFQSKLVRVLIFTVTLG